MATPGLSLTTQDYSRRSYLSAPEAARYLGITVKELHSLVKSGRLGAAISASGQQRFDIVELRRMQSEVPVQLTRKSFGVACPPPLHATADHNGAGDAMQLVSEDGGADKYSTQSTGEEGGAVNRPAISSSIAPLHISINGTSQTVHFSDSRRMDSLEDDSVHLMVTSPPYFDTKMYSREPTRDDLGDIHDLDEWFDEISRTWAEVLRVLQPGRKAFINIMNLPVRERGSFRSLNLVGRTIDVCERLGFTFRRDIVWHKTNGVRAHFGTYPYPGGILINNMHEFILEFQKPERKGFDKYGHLTREQKEASKMDKDFWLSLKNSDVWLMKPQMSGDGRMHVAPFPYELPFRLIKAYSYIGETVLDPFCGSGVALKAAADLGRNGVGYEIVPDFRQTIENVLAGTQRGPQRGPRS